jgi:hypothetical protein
MFIVRSHFVDIHVQDGILVNVVSLSIIRRVVSVYLVTWYRRAGVQKRVVPDDLGDFGAEEDVGGNGGKDLNVTRVR